MAALRPLTYEVKDPHSPVGAWLRGVLPNTRTIPAEFRAAAGALRVLASTAVAPVTQGAAIDWWIRILLDPAPEITLALYGTVTSAARLGELPWTQAAHGLLRTIGIPVRNSANRRLILDQRRLVGEQVRRLGHQRLGH